MKNHWTKKPKYNNEPICCCSITPGGMVVTTSACKQLNPEPKEFTYESFIKFLGNLK